MCRSFRMQNILYITYCDPMLMSSGNEQRTHLLYEALKKVGDVYVIELVENGIGRVRERYYRCLLAQPSRAKKFVNLMVCHTLHRLTRGVIEGYLPFSLVLDVAGCFPGVKFDCVVKRYMSKLGSVHLWNIAPLYVDIDDHPLEVYQTCVRPKIGWRHCYVSVLHRVYRWLVERHVSGGWVANASQVLWSHFKTPDRCLPNLPKMPSADYRVDAVRESYVFSIGLMAYPANYEGVDHFVSAIWPSVHAQFPTLQYRICGKGAPTWLSQKWTAVPGVKVMGFVEDLEGLYAHALATVVPIDQGGGTCLKTLESMSYSRVCLSTTFGVRGLPEDAVRNGTCGVVTYQTAEELVSQLRQVVFEEKRRKALESAGREYVRKNCSIEKFEQAVRDVVGV